MNYLRNNDTGAQYNFDSAPMNQNALALDYSSPIEIGGVGKGYRLKNDPFSAVLADGRTVQMGVDSEATKKLQLAQLALQERQQKMREGELDIQTKRAQLDGSKRPAAPSGFMWNPEGTGVVKIPGFEDGGKPTEDQQKAAGYLLRMQHAIEVQDEIARKNPEAMQPGWGERIASKFSEPLANSLRSPERQRMDAVNTDATDAALTLATGAAYTKEQLEGARKAYAPSIMDDPKAADEKRVLFNNMIQSARLRAGPMASKVDATMGQGRNTLPSEGGSISAPKVGSVVKGHMFLGGNPADPSRWNKVQ